MYDDAVKMAQGAVLMTGTEIDTIQTVGSAWGRHFNKPVAEVMYANIQRVGLPQWDDKDQELAHALQRELGERERGLADSIPKLGEPVDLERSLGGGSGWRLILFAGLARAYISQSIAALKIARNNVHVRLAFPAPTFELSAFLVYQV